MKRLEFVLACILQHDLRASLPDAQFPFAADMANRILVSGGNLAPELATTNLHYAIYLDALRILRPCSFSVFFLAEYNKNDMIMPGTN